MKTISCIILFLYCVCIISCHSRQVEKTQEGRDSNDTIFVSYQEGIYETSAPTTCKEMKEWSEDEEVSEVITINKEYYDAICSYLIENANKENDDMTCEARLYVQISEHEMCIGDLGCACDINDKDIPANKYILYLIRSLSGYYNYFYSLDLQYDRLIKEYGMPVNYEDRTVKHINWEDEENYNDFRKVALVRE